jgi:hypothetical protein
MTLPQTSAGLAQAMDKLAEEAQKEAKRVEELMTQSNVSNVNGHNSHPYAPTGSVR